MLEVEILSIHHLLTATSGTVNTGGGGGGGNGTSNYASGGSGVVIVRYKVGSVLTAKASGGSVSFYSDKTIHTFTSSGTFVAPGTFNETLEYVVVAGGGGGSGFRCWWCWWCWWILNWNHSNR